MFLNPTCCMPSCAAVGAQMNRTSKRDLSGDECHVARDMSQHFWNLPWTTHVSQMFWTWVWTEPGQGGRNAGPPP